MKVKRPRLQVWLLQGQPAIGAGRVGCEHWAGRAANRERLARRGTPTTLEALQETLDHMAAEQDSEVGDAIAEAAKPKVADANLKCWLDCSRGTAG